MNWQRRWLDRFYDPAKGWRNGTDEFFAMIARRTPLGGKILEIGAGPSNQTSRFLAELGEVHGLDPDPDVASNDALAGWALLEGERFPFEDGVFDVCVSNYVIEHVEDARAHLAEIRRVLAPGGAYLFRTPNLFHYVGLAAHFTPHSFHLLVANRLRDAPEDSHDPYPTMYRLNTRRAIRRAARVAGLSVERLAMVESEPLYGLSNRALFLLFTAYERVVNASEIFAGLRVNILGSLGKGVV
jgi:SAM-dependent methyltransferase